MCSYMRVALRVSVGVGGVLKRPTAQCSPPPPCNGLCCRIMMRGRQIKRDKISNDPMMDESCLGIN